MARADRKPYRVLPNKSGSGGKWVVKRTGANRRVSTHQKKSAAINAAKRIAKRNGVGIIIHRANGHVQRGMDHVAVCGR